MANETAGRERAAGESGFALILALLALMLLTFLGLTLATTTSTELQVAANYRWSQQAYYNAEAGIEAAKIILRRIQDATQILPVARAGVSWNEYTVGTITTPGTTAIQSRATRNFENFRCDGRGNGVGYGSVVDDNFAGAPYENVTSMFGQPIRGAFTIWARRPVVANTVGSISDNLGADTVIITAEGVAPSVTSPNRAVRVLETTFLVQPPCPGGENQQSATGGSPCQQH